MAQALSLLLDRELVALNRAVGELRRRRLPIVSIALGPGDPPGRTRLTVIVDTDEVTAEMTMKKLQQLSGVRGAACFSVADGAARELALVKVRVGPERHAELLGVCDLFKATVVDETPDEAVVELAGPDSFVLAFVRALETFGILELVRSGALVLPRPGPAPAPAPAAAQ